MKATLETALTYVLASEGGYSNHKQDPGGPTNKGITQRVYDGYRRRIGKPVQSVRGILAEEVAAIYKSQYWDAIRGDSLPVGLDYAVFDYAVNSGPKRAAQELQRVLGVAADGIIGEITLAAANDADVFATIEALCNRRMAFLRGLKTWPTFGKGWARRVMGDLQGTQSDDLGVVDRATALALGQHMEAPSAPAQGKAEDMGRSSIGESKTVQASVMQMVSGGGAALATVSGLGERSQTIVLVFAGLSVLLAVFILRERIKAWASGWR